MPLNQQIHLISRPQGEATVANFSLVTTETPDLKDGQVLVRHHYLSLDPNMRGRMNDSKSYTAPQALGETMGGGTVGMPGVTAWYGLVKMPEALLGLLKGRNFGKQLVQLV